VAVMAAWQSFPDTEMTVTDDGLTRRDVLQLIAATGVGSLAGGRLLAKAPATLGVQLYTVRDQIVKDPEATLKAIAAIGYKEVEVLRATLAKVAPLAKQLGLAPVSVHVDMPLITGNWAGHRELVKAFPAAALPEGYDLAACIRDAQAAGAKYLVMPYLMPNERPKDAAGFTAFGQTLQKAGDEITKAGLDFCYHNHAFEFAPLPDGRRPLDVMLAACDPAVVKLELDVFWVSITGADPVALIRQYAGRIPLMHLKDKAKGAPTALDESVPPTTFVEVGSGAIDFPAVLAAADAAKVQHYFVEQDQSPDPIGSLAKSYKYLASLT
jgi:sugar phosphate isomerase/epimerase